MQVAQMGGDKKTKSVEGSCSGGKAGVEGIVKSYDINDNDERLLKDGTEL